MTCSDDITHPLLGPQVLKVDAAGHFLPYKAVAAGKSEQEAMNFMEKKVTEMPTLDEEGCVEMAISTMQYVMSTDFKGNAVEFLFSWTCLCICHGSSRVVRYVYCSTLTHLLHFSGSEIEVAIVAKGKKLRKLGNDEIEDRLNSIAEKNEL